MPQIVLETKIAAPAEVCFDLLRDMRIHDGRVVSIDQNERGTPAGDGGMSLGQTVTFASTYFGIKQSLTVRVIELDRPRRFVDVMVKGPLTSLVHVHDLEARGGGTLLRDTLIWETPFGVAGRLADRVVLGRRLRRMVKERNLRLKQLAETGA